MTNNILENLFSKKFHEIKQEGLLKVKGGKYYGNGLYVNKKTGSIYVNWEQTVTSIANNSSANLFTGGAAGWNNRY